MQYEAVIGLEVHVQLKTVTKIFSRVPYTYGAPVNTLIDPVVLSLPGTLPVINKAAIDKMITMGLMFDCRIADICKWDRKNYWYPDSPKNYQISQYDQPLCIGGQVEVELPGSGRNVMGEHKFVELTRIHLEEDPGKLTHFKDYSLIDDNRTGVALAEIVTEPCLRSSDEAVAFLKALVINLSSAGVSDCDMEKGQLRCDANVSVRPVGDSTFGIRTEMKNLNSFSNVKAAIEYEIKRQVRLCQEGKKQEIVQETRRWNADKGYSISMRSKEDSHDYRYFPDPDLMPVKVDEAWKADLKEKLPERPYDRQRRYMDELGLPYTAASVLIQSLEFGDFFDRAVAVSGKAKECANFIVNDLMRELAAAGAEGEGSLPLHQCRLTPNHIGELVQLIDQGTISKQIAQDIFSEMFAEGKMPSLIVQEKGLKQENNSEELEKICAEVIAADAVAVEKFKSGNEKAINAFKGPIMKATRGKANPQVVDELLRKLLAQQ
ncbi:MAG: Asp-tRNA(Asn)/Glu-tRNA(Gln) amidotransferase subunit GatB [Opitutales bacterium]|nr:Asp-tRNA(Asn)/Glu-tRNA(Gln) amidotransferase subunit GatB [Opitutales bacterium]